ncbi:ATP-grasp domain-containing protein [Actinomadura sp. ATCC 39365]
MRELLYIELGFSDYASYGAALALSQGRPIRLAAQYPDKSMDFEFQTTPKPLAAELDLFHRFSGVDAVSTMSLPDLLTRYSGHDLAGVISYSDAHLMNAALLAQHLGLPGADPTGIENCVFKDRAREMTNPLGHPVTYAVRVAENAGDTSPVGYPCVVKPVVGRASYGVSVCHDDASYVAAVDEAIIYYRATSGGAESVPSILVEEYVEGPEYSGELIWDDIEGRWRLLGVTNTALMTPPPVRREIGHIFPWSFGSEVDDTVEETLIAWLNAVGHRRGAAHIEFKMEANRPALIEINPRLPGVDSEGLSSSPRGSTSSTPTSGSTSASPGHGRGRFPTTATPCCAICSPTAVDGSSGSRSPPSPRRRSSKPRPATPNGSLRCRATPTSPTRSHWRPPRKPPWTRPPRTSTPFRWSTPTGSDTPTAQGQEGPARDRRRSGDDPCGHGDLGRHPAQDRLPRGG